MGFEMSHTLRYVAHNLAHSVGGEGQEPARGCAVGALLVVQDLVDKMRAAQALEDSTSFETVRFAVPEGVSSGAKSGWDTANA